MCEESDNSSSPRLLMGSIIPSSTSDDNLDVVDVELQMLSFWDKTEAYLKMISVPLIIVGVTVAGFLCRFFKEIIIPTILALFLFQISKPIVLRLHKPIIPYFWFVEENPSEEEGLLLDSNRVRLFNRFYVIE